MNSIYIKIKKSNLSKNFNDFLPHLYDFGILLIAFDMILVLTDFL
jgi:hypothetical protein